MEQLAADTLRRGVPDGSQTTEAMNVAGQANGTIGAQRRDAGTAAGDGDHVVPAGSFSTAHVQIRIGVAACQQHLAVLCQSDCVDALNGHSRHVLPVAGRCTGIAGAARKTDATVPAQGYRCISGTSHRTHVPPARDFFR